MSDERVREACRLLAALPEGSPVVVSACLLGVPCRYDGRAKRSGAACGLARRLQVVPVCPEQTGGLPTPRPPAEMQADGRVLMRGGTDVTEEFSEGARVCLEQALKSGARVAVLRAKSPSCGVSSVYDGSFTGTLTCGKGLFARLLADAGVMLLDEGELERMRPLA